MACPTCRSPGIIYDPETGEECCGACGMVVGAAAAGTVPGDLHAPMRKDANSTVVGSPDAGSSRLRRTDDRIRSKSVPAHLRADRLVRLHAIHERLGLPKPARGHSEGIYREAAGCGITRRREAAAVMAASAYVTCRELGIPRTLRDAEAASGARRKSMAKCVRLLLDMRGGVPRHGLEVLVVRAANNLGVEGPCRREAVEVVGRLGPEYPAGKSPVAIAAAVLHVALSRRNAPYTITAVAEAAGTNSLTVAKHSKEIRELV